MSDRFELVGRLVPVPQPEPVSPIRHTTKRHEDAVLHLFVVETSEVRGLMLEEAREATKGEVRGRCERDAHPSPSDISTTSRTPGRCGHDDLDLAPKSGGVVTTRKEPSEIVCVVARSVLQDEFSGDVDEAPCGSVDRILSIRLSVPGGFSFSSHRSGSLGVQ